MITRGHDTIHRLTNCQRRIFDKGYRINVDERRSFSYQDFTEEFTHGTIRNAFSTLVKDGIILRIFRSNLTFYAVKGTGILSGPIGTMTPTPVGDHRNLFLSLPPNDDSVHDIRISFVAEGLYDSLLGEGWKPSHGNKDIPLRGIKYSANRSLKIRVHRTNNTTVLISCSREPFRVRDGMGDLILLLDHVRYLLENEYLPTPIRIPPIAEWRVVQWHHGIDSNRSFSGDSFNLTVIDWHNCLVRFYSKRIGIGKQYRARLERVESPHRSLEEILGNLPLLE